MASSVLDSIVFDAVKTINLIVITSWNSNFSVEDYGQLHSLKLVDHLSAMTSHKIAVTYFTFMDKLWGLFCE